MNRNIETSVASIERSLGPVQTGIRELVEAQRSKRDELTTLAQTAADTADRAVLEFRKLRTDMEEKEEVGVTELEEFGRTLNELHTQVTAMRDGAASPEMLNALARAAAQMDAMVVDVKEAVSPTPPIGEPAVPAKVVAASEPGEPPLPDEVPAKP